MSKIIVSIPYTGTRFLRRNFEALPSIHTYTPWSELLEGIEGKEIIAPLRDPAKNWDSWARRWLPEVPIENQVANYVRAWYVMHALTLIKNIDFIPVDIPEYRDPRIKTWDKVGNKDKGDRAHEFTTGFIYDLPFVQKYYTAEKEK